MRAAWYSFDASRTRPNWYGNLAIVGYLLTASLQAASADPIFISPEEPTPGTVFGRWGSLGYAANQSQSVTISGCELVADEVVCSVGVIATLVRFPDVASGFGGAESADLI